MLQFKGEQTYASSLCKLPLANMFLKLTVFAFSHATGGFYGWKNLEIIHEILPFQQGV